MKKLGVLLLVAFIGVWSVFAAGNSVKKWTFLVVVNGDNNLEGAGFDDIDEMEKIGSTADVNILVLFDRARGYVSYDGDWTGAKIFYITKGHIANKIESKLLKDLGEIDLGDYREIVKFVKFGKENFPAEKYGLVIWNHGGGWKKKTKEQLFKGISYDDSSNNHIESWELSAMAKEIDKVLGKNLDFLGMDACLMGAIEVAYELHGLVNYLTFSEKTEPGDGWPYDDFLSVLVKNPDMSAKDLAVLIAEKYVESYDGGSQGRSTVTQSAIDLGKMDELVNAVSMLAEQLKGYSKDKVRNAFKYVTGFGGWYSGDYRDLKELVQAARKIDASNKDLQAACDLVDEAMKKAVLYAGGTGNLKNVGGLTIWFPTSTSSSTLKKYSYLRFSQDGEWDDLLNQMYGSAKYNVVK